MMFITIWWHMVMRSVIEEKTNQIIEIIILLGKTLPIDDGENY
jgi:ABC-type Na+ efflux pump permease subunit